MVSDVLKAAVLLARAENQLKAHAPGLELGSDEDTHEAPPPFYSRLRNAENAENDRSAKKCSNMLKKQATS